MVKANVKIMRMLAKERKRYAAMSTKDLALSVGRLKEGLRWATGAVYDGGLISLQIANEELDRR